jgi:hypothetical protein
MMTIDERLDRLIEVTDNLATSAANHRRQIKVLLNALSSRESAPETTD